MGAFGAERPEPDLYVERFWKVLRRPPPRREARSVLTFGRICTVLDFPRCSLGHFEQVGVTLRQPFYGAPVS